MEKIVLISCGSKKMNKRTKAKEMYQSPLFKNSLEYALKLNPNKIFILSAHYGLLDLETEIEPYDVTISNVSKQNRLKKPELKVLNKSEKIEWGKKIIEKLATYSNIEKDVFIVLAGLEYVKPIIPYLNNVEQPLKGVGLFDRISHLKKLKNEI
tara:strand:- start:1035 stop:1496 length:462 start_codon:yes stop_codon:yes gene_type:complete